MESLRLEVEVLRKKEEPGGERSSGLVNETGKGPHDEKRKEDRLEGRYCESIKVKQNRRTRWSSLGTIPTGQVLLRKELWVRPHLSSAKPCLCQFQPSSSCLAPLHPEFHCSMVLLLLTSTPRHLSILRSSSLAQPFTDNSDYNHHYTLEIRYILFSLYCYL
ncbi:mCG118662, partial [Mus musculus]